MALVVFPVSHGRLLDASPNVVTEMGAVSYDIGRQPRGAHDFFLKYQDRLLFGKDAYAAEEFPCYWRVLETKDEYSTFRIRCVSPPDYRRPAGRVRERRIASPS